MLLDSGKPIVEHKIMTKTFAYLEQCREVHSEVMNKELSAPETLYKRYGGSYWFESLGRIETEKYGGLDVGQKIMHKYNNGNFEYRLAAELFFGTLIYEYCPELKPNVPLFVGYSRQNGIKTIVTEDASKGGRLTVSQESASLGLRAALVSGLGKLVTPDNLLRNEELDSSSVYRAGEREIILDITPLPFNTAAQRSIRRANHELIHAASAIIPELEFSFTEAAQ